MSLADLPVGSHALVTGVHGERLQKMKLLDMGLTPDARVFVNKVAPMGDPMEVAVRGTVLTLRRAEAELIDVDHYACAVPPEDAEGVR